MKPSQSVRQKLHSQRGASLLITLLFFMVCLLVASVTLTAASAGFSRTVKQRTEQKLYLSVSSAAQLLQNELETMPDFEARKEVLSHQCGQSLSIHLTGGDFQTKEGEWTLTGDAGAAVLQTYLWQDALALCKAPDTAPEAHTFTIEPDDESMSAVRVKMTAGTVKTDAAGQNSYQIVFTLSAVDPDDKSKTLSTYAMTLSAEASVSSASDGGKDDPQGRYCTYESTGKYWDPVLGEWRSLTGQKVYKLTTYTCTVRWGGVKLTKEA